MAHKPLIVMLLSVVLPVIGAAQASPTVKVTEDKPGLLKRAKIAPDSAIRLAQAAVPTGKVTAGEIEEEKGKLIYSFDIKVPGKSGITEIHIDPTTGAVVGREHEEDPAAPATSKPKAAKP